MAPSASADKKVRKFVLKFESTSRSSSLAEVLRKIAS